MTTSTVPVSAVIPAFNADRFLGETLDSVRGQTRSVDEIVVVDDGSSDDTSKVARSHDARVIQHEKNRGVSAARNTGIQASRNEWVALLDADDLWKPRKIERQYRIVERHPDVRLVFSDEEHRRDGDLVQSSFLGSHRHYPQVDKDPLEPDTWRLDRASAGQALFPGNYMKPSTMLLRRDLFEEAEGFDERFTAPDSRIGTCEDQDLAMRLTMCAEPVVIERPLVVYRIREGSVSSDTVGLKLGYAYLADKVMADPGRYPEGAVEHFRRRKPVVLRQAAVECMHDGSFDLASSLLRRSLRSGVTWRALGALLVCTLGERAFSLLLGVKRRLQLPGLQ